MRAKIANTLDPVLARRDVAVSTEGTHGWVTSVGQSAAIMTSQTLGGFRNGPETPHNFLAANNVCRLSS
jgi:GTP cyclohydrolase I